MVDKIVTSPPFSLFVSKEMRASCKPEQLAWLRSFKPFAQTEQGIRDAESESRKVQLLQTKPVGNSTEEKDAQEKNEEPTEGIPADVSLFCRKLTSAHAETQKGKLDALNRFYISHFTQTLYHPIGTCKMGTPDIHFVVYHKRSSSWHRQQLVLLHLKGNFRQRLSWGLQRAKNYDAKRQRDILLPRWSKTSVVDGSLRLCGGMCVQNIRIVDASIFPHLPSGNTHIPTVVLAHVAAEAIAEHWSG